MDAKLIESKSLKYTESRKIVADGDKYIITAMISLDDKCKNKTCEWSITGEMYKCGKDWYKLKGIDSCVISGAIGDKIYQYMPELRDFVNMHLNNYLGQPSYPVENGMYWLKKNLGKGMEYLGLDREEAKILSIDLDDKKYFKYQLFNLGIVDRWKEKSDRLIKRLEEMTEKKWVNPYKPEEERFVLRITEEEKKEIEEKIESGYYAKEAVQERINEKRAEERKKIEIEYERQLKNAIDEIGRKKMVDLYLFDRGITNAIYYPSSNKIEFNWKSWENKISKDEFDGFVKTFDKTKLPEGITFKMS